MTALRSINLRPGFTEKEFVSARKVRMPLKRFTYADIVTGGTGFDFDQHWRQKDEALIGVTRA